MGQVTIGFALLATLCWLPGANGAQQRPSLDAARRAAQQELRAFSGEWNAVPALEAALRDHGPELVPWVLDALLDGELRGEAGTDALPLDAPCALALTLTLGQLPWEKLRAELEQCMKRSSTVQRRLAALALVDRYGSADDATFAASIGLGVATGSEVECEPEIRTGYRDLLTRLLARDSQSSRDLESLLRDAPPELAEESADAVGRLGTLASFEALVRVLDALPDRRSLILVHLRRLVARLEPPPGDELREPIRKALDNFSEAGMVGFAASLLRELRDVAAIPDLIAALEECNGDERTRVAETLRSLARVRLGTDAGPWSTWYDSQLRWAENELQAKTRALQSGDVGVAVEAIRALAAHPALGELVCEPLRAALQHKDPQVRQFAAATLGELTDWGSVPALVPWLERSEPGVRATAHAALVRITRWSLPADARAWKKRLDRNKEQR
jgi:HEAT repeats